MKKTQFALLITATLPSVVFAKNTQDQTATPVIIISGYATPQTENKTASSVTVLDETDFKQRSANYVSDILKTVPSATFSSSGGRGTLTNLYLRGADANHTAVIIDGIKMNPVTGYGFDFGGLPLSNIERIEVLRGEQSALWGSDAMGGVVYITTKNGLSEATPFNVNFDFGLGSHNTKDASATVSGYANGFYYAVHGDSHSTKGISAYSSDSFNYTAEDGTAITTGGATESDKFHRDNASVRLGYEFDDAGIEFLAKHSTQSSHYDSSLFTETTFDDYTRTRQNIFKLSGYLGSEEDLFKQTASVSHIKTNADTFGSWASDYQGKKLDANYQLDINFDRTGTITQAVSLLTEFAKNYYDSSSYSDEKTLTDKSVALEYRLFSENDHSFSISGRYDDNDKFENAFTARIAGAYRLNPNFKLHSSLGTAIQNPTMTEYYGYYGSYSANTDLKPEKSRGGDMGLKMESNNHFHSLDVTYFNRAVDDLISSEYSLTTGLSRAVNTDGTSRIQGVELSYQGQFTDRLSGYANYTYTYTRAKDSDSNELVRRPKHLANAGVHYQITDKFGSDLNVSYVGKRINNYWDASYISHAVKMPSYTLVNLGANYQLNDNLNLYANINNLFDKKYENVIGYGQEGRNFYVGIKGNW